MGRVQFGAGVRAFSRRNRVRTPGVTVANRAGPSTRSYINARKRAGTRTATKLLMYRKKRSSKYNVVRSSMGGLPSMSQFVLNNKPSKRVAMAKKLGAPNIWITNYGKQIYNQEGFQEALAFTFGGLTDLQTIATKVPDTTQVVRQFYLQSIVGELMMTNSSLATQYVDIYDIVRKRDVGKGQGTSDPFNAWKYGVSDQDPAGPNLTDYQIITSKPTDSRLMNDWFKIVKKSRVGLVAGATHRHRVNYNINKIIDTELVNRSQGDLTGYCVYTLIVINGQPASASDEAGAVVTTAKTALDVVQSTRWKYTWIADTSVRWDVVNNLSTLANEQITQPSLGAFVLNTIQ